MPFAGFDTGGGAAPIMQGAALGQQSAHDLNQWLTNFMDEQKKVAAQGKAADYAVKGDDTLLQDAGKTPEEFQNLGAREKAGLVSGVMQSRAAKQVAAENAARTEEQRQRALLMQAQLRALQEKRELEASEAGAPAALFQTLEQGNTANQQGKALDFSLDTLRQTGIPLPDWAHTPDLPPMPDRMVHAIAQMGPSNPRYASALARQVMPTLMGQGSAPKEFFQRTDTGQPLPGAKGWIRIPTGPNTSQLVYAGDDVGVPQAAHDEEGNLIGHTVVDAKGRSVFHAFKGGSKFPPARNAETGEIIPDAYVSPEGKILDWRSGVFKLTGPTGSAKLAGTSGGDAGKSKVATKEVARGYLQRAKGDVAKARQLAQDDGYTIE